jgi:hypothetical protein
MLAKGQELSRTHRAAKVFEHHPQFVNIKGLGFHGHFVGRATQLQQAHCTPAAYA